LTLILVLKSYTFRKTRREKNTRQACSILESQYSIIEISQFFKYDKA